ncbi:MAG: hypothetical protein IIU08_06240, partial [Clostridia bacterium]|nr:hypothetical protein [Clostridia bacterium]
CGFAYAVALVVYQIGSLFTGEFSGVGSVIGLIAAFALIALCAYMLFRPYKEATTLSEKAVA